MTYFVSRQHYWPDGDLVVEIAGGGLDYSNPDMLCSMWPEHGEGKEYEDPREALKAAIKIRDAWIISLADRNGKIQPDGTVKLGEDDEPRIETGHTGGYTMPFCSYPEDSVLVKWAEEAYEKLDKCAHCNRVLSDLYMQHRDFCDDEDPKFCADDNMSCAEHFYGSCGQCGDLLDGDPNPPTEMIHTDYPYAEEPLKFCCMGCKETWEEENA